MEFRKEQRRAPRHAKYDAIHRALLTGLLSNVGTRGDAYEYLGTRGTKFLIFPGSGLFAGKPKWVVAGELVETTKLYARVCAKVEPQWIERAAGHLVERSYSEPRWDAGRQGVIATEKVVLFGLVLVPARVVAFGPINPKLSREIFIQHALVLGELRTEGGGEGAFFKFNANLVAEVELLEAKIRQRNLLADVATRFAFYDAKLPLGITNGADFEKWRRRVERVNPRFLYMSKDDLLRADAPAITAENYPDKLSESGGGLKLPVHYRYEPSDTMDGLTVTVPLAGLGQMVAERYEWLVPGMLEEKIAAMIKGLPGGLRRNFVPVPQWAKAAATAIGGVSPGTAHPQVPGLRATLANYLERETGVEIRAEDFVEWELPEFLRMNFRVVDDAGNIVGMGRELGVLQRKLAKEAAGTLEGIVQGKWNRSGIVRWDFGELPESVTLQRFGMTIVGYPALVEVGEEGGGCGLRLLTSLTAAEESHRAGVRRLFFGEHRRAVKGLTGKLPDFAKMKLQYLLLGRSKELQEDLLTLIVDQALYGSAGNDPAPPILLRGEVVPRNVKEYQTATSLALSRLNQTAEMVGELAAKILEEHLKLALLMEERNRNKSSAEIDVHDQLVFLLPKHFLVKTTYAWLEQFPRYLAGMRVRLEKLRGAGGGGRQIAERDAAGIAKVRLWWLRYLDARAKHEAVAIRDAELELLRWMIEEWRVAIFAQELGTAIQISERRIEKQWEKVRR